MTDADGSVFEDGGLGPFLCHHFQGQTQNSEQVGEQGVCGGMAALPKPTIVYGMSHRQGRIQPHPKHKLPVAHQQQLGTGRMWKFCWGRWTQWYTNYYATWELCISSQLESMPNSLSPFDPGLTSMDPTDEGLQADNDTPAPLRQSLRMMSNQPLYRYQNFTLQLDDIHPSAFNIWVGLCICLHIITCVHIAFFREYHVKTIYLSHNRSAQHKQFLTLMRIPSISVLWWILDGGSGLNDVWSKCSCPIRDTKQG